MMAERMGFGGWSAVVATWVSVIGAFGGGFLALQTYSQDVAKQEDARVVQTFSLYDMFNSSERLQSRQKLFKHMRDGEDYEPNDLYVFLDFYDAVQICVQRDLCDRELAIRLFQSYAVPIWDSMKRDITSARTDSDPNFGAGLQWMASQPLPPPLPGMHVEPEATAPETTTTSSTTETATGTTTAVP